jgi:hypothetical protein
MVCWLDWFGIAALGWVFSDQAGKVAAANVAATMAL